MRPRLLTILLLLLAGAVVNVGVAWACAWWVPVGDAVAGCIPATPWFVLRADGLGVTWLETDQEVVGDHVFYGSLSPLVASEDIIPAWAERKIAVRDNQLFFATGWPLRALECRVDLTVDVVDGAFTWGQLVGGFGLPDSWKTKSSAF